MPSNKIIKAAGKKFGFTIANANSDSVVIALLAGLFFTTLVTVTAAGSPLVYSEVVSENDVTAINAAGYAVDAILDDGTPATGITVSPSFTKFSVRSFRKYIQHNPIVLKTLTMQATHEDCFAQGLEFTDHSPLESTRIEYVDLSTFKSVNQQSDTKIVLDELDIELNCNTIMKYTIPAGRSVSFLLQFE